MIEAVLFDVDGTLVDHRSAVLAALEGLVTRFPGSRLPPDGLIDLWWDLERRHMASYLSGACSFAEQRRRRLREFLPLLGEADTADDAALDAWFAVNYLREYEGAWHCYGDVTDCLEQIHALPSSPMLEVVTNGNAAQQQQKLERCDLSASFSRVFTPQELGAPKPDPTTFLAACDHLGVVPEQTVYVGDWLEGDAVAASRAGLNGVWLDRGVDPVTGWSTSPDAFVALPVTRIASLTELPAMVSADR